MRHILEIQTQLFSLWSFVLASFSPPSSSLLASSQTAVSCSALIPGAVAVRGAPAFHWTSRLVALMVTATSPLLVVQPRPVVSIMAAASLSIQIRIAQMVRQQWTCLIANPATGSLTATIVRMWTWRHRKGWSYCDGAWQTQFGSGEKRGLRDFLKI